MPKKKEDVMQEVLDYISDKPGLLFIVGNPIRDELMVSFGGKQTYVKFPQTKNPKDNILVQVMSKSGFKEATNELLVAMMKALELSPKDGAQLYHVVGGSLQAMLKK